MSYCRWSKGESDVYVYEDVSGGFTCCGCTLEKWEMETETDRPGFNALTHCVHCGAPFTFDVSKGVFAPEATKAGQAPFVNLMLTERPT